MHLLLINGCKTYYHRIFPTYLTYFLNKSKFVMNTSLPDIYNNLNNYSVTKRPFTSTPPSQGQRQKIFYYFILKI
jgi:hypothetical protein